MSGKEAYISKNFNRNIHALRKTMPSSSPDIKKKTDEFEPIVPDYEIDLYEKVGGVESNFSATILRESGIIIDFGTDNEIKKVVSETEKLIEKSENEQQLTSNLKEIQDKYPPSFAAARVFKDLKDLKDFKDFKEKLNRINTFKLLFNDKNQKRKEKIETRDKNNNTPFHLLVKSFSKNSKPNASPSSTASTASTASHSSPASTTSPSSTAKGIFSEACNNALDGRDKYMKMLEELSSMLRVITGKPKVQLGESKEITTETIVGNETPNESILHSAQLLADSLHKPEKKLEENKNQMKNTKMKQFLYLRLILNLYCHPQIPVVKL
jgi:hypothetical protein